MDERSRNVRKASAALYLENEMSEFNGAMDGVTTAFEWHVLT